MRDLVRRIDEDEFSERTGSILCSWFVAHPNGPTAWALGYVETGTTNALFYRWMHFTGGRTYLIGLLEDELRSWEDDIGGVTANAILRVHNQFARTGEDTRPFPAVPSAIISNGNRRIDAAVRMILEAGGHDWGRAAYYTRKYGNDFFGRSGEELREAYEKLRQKPGTDPKFLRHLWLLYQHNPTFANWRSGQYRSAGFTQVVFDIWWNTVTNRAFLYDGAMDRFAEMWVGATETARGRTPRFDSGGDYVPLRDVVNFFANFHMSILPDFTDEALIRRRLGFDMC